MNKHSFLAKKGTLLVMLIFGLALLLAGVMFRSRLGEYYQSSDIKTTLGQVRTIQHYEAGHIYGGYRRTS